MYASHLLNGEQFLGLATEECFPKLTQLLPPGFLFPLNPVVVTAACGHIRSFPLGFQSAGDICIMQQILEARGFGVLSWM